MKVLILCTGNSCRSQIAEGFLRQLAGDRADVYSAGVETHGLNPRAVQTMAEAGLDISGHRSKLAAEFLGIGITHVITVCDHAAEVCPFFPEDVKFSHFNFPDPAKAKGTEAEIMAQFGSVRDMIRDYLTQWWAANRP
ncbi:MAG TPA: arsenate reductase ArsC [Bacteroidia bacterium]|nr:arsenate reductase ArsC [Bacteroidia bacterium]